MPSAKTCSVRSHVTKRSHLLRLGVKSARRFVEQYDARVPQERPRDGDPLFLSAAELSASRAAVCLEALRERLDECQYVGVAGCPLDGFRRDFGSRVQRDVVSDRSLEESGFLRD